MEKVSELQIPGDWHRGDGSSTLGVPVTWMLRDGAVPGLRSSGQRGYPVPGAGVGRWKRRAARDRQPRGPGRGPRGSLTGPAALGRSHYCSSLRTPGPPRRPGAWPVQGTGCERAEHPSRSLPWEALTEHHRRPRFVARGLSQSTILPRLPPRLCSSHSSPAPFI